MALFTHKSKKSVNLHKSTSVKRGFTLLETMLAVGLLVIVSLVVYQGFVSTMQLTKNTSLFEKSGNISAGVINNSLQNSNAAPSVTPSQGLFLQNSGTYAFQRVVSVTVYKAVTATNTNYGDPKYYENPTNTTNRSGFTFQGPLCPNDHTELKWYLRTDGSGTYSLFCPKGDYTVP